MSKIEIPNVKQFHNETDYNYQQRLQCLHYLGDKYILATKMQKPAVVAWRG